MTQNKNTSSSNYNRGSCEVNQNWNLLQLYQYIESIKLQEKQESLTDLEKVCLKGLFCGYTPEMITQELSEKLDYYLVQSTLWTIYRYIKTITIEDNKKITNYQDVLDSLEASGYKAENADTILLTVNEITSLSQSQILLPQSNKLPKVINSASTSSNFAVLPPSQSKKVISLNLKLPMLLLSGILIFLLTLFGSKLLKQPTASTADSKEVVEAQNSSLNTILSVETTKVNLVESYQVERTYTGTIVSRRSSSLGFERSGKLLNLSVDRGHFVQAGTPLATLDTRTLKAKQQELLAEKKQVNAVLQELKAGVRSETIAASQSRVNSLQSQLKLAQTKSQRRQKLYSSGAISREQLDEATTDVNTFQARLNEAKSRLDELRAGTRPEKIAAQQASLEQLNARLASLQLEIEQSTLKAPFSGRIDKRLVDEGTVVSTGEAIYTLVEGNALEVHIGVPVDTAAQIPVGSNQKLQIGSKTYQAKVLSTLPQLDSATRTLTIVLSLDESAAKEVRAKQIARLKLSETITDSGFWLPTTALTIGVRGLWSCYVIGDSEDVTTNPNQVFVVEQREVEVLQTENERVFVRGTLQNNDQVIINGNHRLVTGQLVQKKL